MLIEQLVKDWHEFHEEMHDLRPATLTGYAYQLTRFMRDFDGKTLGDLTEKACRLYIRSKADHSLHTAHSALAALRSFIVYLIDEAYLQGDPTKTIRKLKPPKGKRKPAKEEDIRKLFAACEHRAPAQRTKARAALALCVYGAMRAEEVSLFKFGDLNVETGELIIPNGKGGKERTIGLCNEGIQGVLAYFKGKEPTATLGLSKVQVRYTIKITCQKAGVSHYTPHNFRHSCCTRLLDNKENIHDVKDFMGHSTLATTSLYSHSQKRKMLDLAQSASLNATPKTEAQPVKPTKPQERGRMRRTSLRG